MRPKVREDSGAEDLFRSRLSGIINRKNPLVRLAKRIDWSGIATAYGAHYAEAGRPGVNPDGGGPAYILKHVYDLSDEAVCERWIYDPYFQYFCREQYFQHSLPHDRSAMTRWRQRIGADALGVVQESLGVAHTSGALRLSHVKRVDTTGKGERLPHRREAGVRLACQVGRPRTQAQGHIAPKLYPGWQTGPSDARPLYPRQTLQAQQGKAAFPQ